MKRSNLGAVHPAAKRKFIIDASSNAPISSSLNLVSSKHKGGHHVLDHTSQNPLHPSHLHHNNHHHHHHHHHHPLHGHIQLGATSSNLKANKQLETIATANAAVKAKVDAAGVTSIKTSKTTVLQYHQQNQQLTAACLATENAIVPSPKPAPEPIETESQETSHNTEASATPTRFSKADRRSILSEAPDRVHRTPMFARSRDEALGHAMHSLKFSLVDFDIGKPLGDGAHGVAYLARERRSGFICVLKAIPKPHLLRHTQECLLKKEVEMQAHLRHPHVVSMYTWFGTVSHVFLVMEFCYYGDLFSVMEIETNRRGYSEERVSRMIFEITWAIRSCHDKRIAHLDLKPENIFVNHEKKCKLGDFGLSAHIGSEHGEVHKNRGTHDYWSPEQCSNDPSFGAYDHKADIWTIGVLAYELRVTRPPFGSTCYGASVEDVKRNIMTQDWQQQRAPPLSPELRQFLDACLQKQSPKRPTADSLLQSPFLTKYNQDVINGKAFQSEIRAEHRGFNNPNGKAAINTPKSRPLNRKNALI